MKKNLFITGYKYKKTAFRFLGIFAFSCVLCFLPFCHTYAKETTSSVTTTPSCKYFDSDNSSVEKMQANDTLLEQMKEEQKQLNQTYKQKIIAYKNSNATLTTSQNKKLQQINSNIGKKNRCLKKKLDALSTKQKKYKELNNLSSEKAKKRRKTIIALQNDIINRMKKINRLFKREISILDNAK